MKDRLVISIAMLGLGTAVLGLARGVTVTTTTELEAAPKYLMTEQEDNGYALWACPLLADEYGYGSISLAGDIDWFWRSRQNEPELVFAYADAGGSAYSTDAELKVYAEDGTTLVEHDDDDGPGLIGGRLDPV
jgi:hypothetical protein